MKKSRQPSPKKKTAEEAPKPEESDWHRELAAFELNEDEMRALQPYKAHPLPASQGFMSRNPPNPKQVQKDADDEGWMYEKTGNPLHAWRAYHISRAAGLPLPEFVFGYLDRCVGRLYGDLFRDEATRGKAIAGQGPETHPLLARRGVPQEVATAFGFIDENGRSAFRSYWKQHETLSIALSVKVHLENGHKFDLALDYAAKNWKVSRSTAARAWERWKESESD